MTRLKVRPSLLHAAAALVLIALVLPALLATVADEPAWAKGEGWKSVTLLYTSDVKGKIEPCG